MLQMDITSDTNSPLSQTNFLHSLNFQLSGKFLNVGNFMEILEENSTHLHLQQCFFNLDSIDPKGVVAELQYLTYGGAEE